MVEVQIGFYFKNRTESNSIKNNYVNIKSLGILIIIIGAIMIFYTGFNYVTTEKIIDIGPISINKQQSHPVQWGPIIGVILFIGGIAVVVQDIKK